MTSGKKISLDLSAIAQNQDFVSSSYELIGTWVTEKVGIECVDPVLEFMETNPDLEYGMPGPLVHYVEQFYLRGYEDKLVASVSRKPTASTVWMLNRLINGTNDFNIRKKLVEVMKSAASNSNCDKNTSRFIQNFLDYLESA